MLSLSNHRDGATVTVVVGGEIDISTVDQLAAEIDAAARHGAGSMIVDLSDVTFIDSAGISALLKGRRDADGHGQIYQVTGATGMVRQILDLTGVWQHLSGPAG